MENKNVRLENILLPKGVKVGSANNDKTGVTVILAEEGAVGGVCVRGCAPGTRETDLLSSEKAISFINAVLLSGGSAFGLEASCGVMDYLREGGFGLSVGKVKVPLVASAVLFDLNGDECIFPDKAMGKLACQNAKNSDVLFGSVGAGTGATVGKICGVARSSHGGLGGSTCALGEVFVTAIVAVNAVGDVFDESTNKIVAGAHDLEGGFLDTVGTILSGNFAKLSPGAATTICCVITNAKLTKLECNKLASISHNGYARSIRPVHTDNDGDTIFTMSKGDKMFDFNALSVMAVEAVRLAILNAVKND